VGEFLVCPLELFGQAAYVGGELLVDGGGRLDLGLHVVRVPVYLA
jgi:hypothetical protein